MSLLSRRLLYKAHGIVRNVSLTTSEPNAVTSLKIENKQFDCFRVRETNPAFHNPDHVCAFYTIPTSDEHIFQHGSLPKKFVTQCSTFAETCFMIRKPALEIINYLKTADYNNPIMKYVLYGKPGVGKSITVAHIAHFASVSKWLLLSVPWVGTWLRSPKQIENSATMPGYVDLPDNAVKWLVIFKHQNQSLIKELNLTLGNNYEWSIRETSAVGDSLMDIVELGINRSRHASAIIMAIVKEIKEYSRQGMCKTLVTIDGYNSFFHKTTRVKNEYSKIMPPEKVSLVLPFLEATKNDWHNAAAVLVCDELAVPGHDKSPLPIYQLGMEGFHYIDPFIPVEVPAMTDAEGRSMLAYYRERRWIQDWQADDELLFLGGGNPYKLMTLCNPL